MRSVILGLVASVGLFFGVIGTGNIFAQLPCDIEMFVILKDAPSVAIEPGRTLVSRGLAPAGYVAGLDTLVDVLPMEWRYLTTEDLIALGLADGDCGRTEDDESDRCAPGVDYLGKDSACDRIVLNGEAGKNGVVSWPKTCYIPMRNY